MKITVNSETIPEEAVRREVQKWRQQHLGTNEKEAFEQVSGRIVDWTVIQQEAAKRIDVTPGDVDMEYISFCNEHGSEAAFRRRYNIGEECIPDVKKDIKQRLQTRRLLDEVSKDAPEPTGEALRAYFEENRDEFEHPEKVHAAHIVKHPKSEAAEIEAAAELTAVRKRLLDGEDFLQVAGECSECNDTPPDLGAFARGQMVPEFETVVFSMQPGEISPVFKTPFGLHIATVFERIEAQPMTFEDCRDRIREQLWQDAKNDVIGEWVDAEKAKADIELIGPE